MGARLLRLLTLELAVLAVVPSCHRSPSEPSAAASARASVGPLPVAPRELLAEGTLGRPAETWKRVRAIMGGPALRMPSTLPLAITTLIGASPLVAGLVDDTAPVAFAVLYDEGQPALVAGMRLTSGPEFVAALVNGADARFEAELDQEHDVTLLTLKHSASGGPPGGASDGIAIGVARNLLLLAGAQKETRAAAAYMARTFAPSLQNTDTLTLVARKGALVGPFSSMLQDGLRSAIGGLQAAARTSREAHGRAPDFGDPEAVMEAIAKLADDGAAVLGSAAEVKMVAALLGPIPEINIELAPEPTGEASNLVRALPVGDLSPLLGLPPDTEVALAWERAAAGTEDSGVPRWAAVLGDRLGSTDRKRIAGWMEDVGRGAGPFVMAGLLSGKDEPALFVLSPAGEGAAGRRALGAVPGILKIPALARPLDTFVGPLGITSGSREGPGIGATTELHLRRAARPGAVPILPTGAEAVAVNLLLASSDGRVAMIAGGAGAAGRLAELLTPPPALGNGRDAVVVRAVSRAGKNAAAAGLARFRDELGPPGWAALTVGSDRRVLRVELTVSDVAARTLLRAALAR